MTGVITLTTDFGLSDPYVAIMKGVILSINPGVHLIDVSHQVKHGSISHAAGLLMEAYPFFPDGSIHVAVVDPGVGGGRRPILIKTDKHFFVGPDNGIFWPVISLQQHITVIHLTKIKYFLPHISRTFHGRDIFAPVAGRLSLGVDVLEFGKIINDPTSLKVSPPKIAGDALFGEILRVDHFGNLITNVHRKDLEEFLDSNQPVIRAGNLIIEGMHKTYSDVDEDEVLALIGSNDHLEIAVNSGCASALIKVDLRDIVGMKVEVRKAEKADNSYHK